MLKGQANVIVIFMGVMMLKHAFAWFIINLFKRQIYVLHLVILIKMKIVRDMVMVNVFT